MTSFSTEAIVLHAADYLESSRILRLLTRDAGVQSVLARGARTSRKRFGSALDLFAQGHADVQVKDGRDLHTLHSFEVTTSRSSIGRDLTRFTAAAAFAEIVLRIVHDESAVGVFAVVERTMQRIESAAAENVTADTVGGMWQLVAELGVAPALDICASCHKSLAVEEDVRFSHRAGGALCARCASTVAGSRRLPLEARQTISDWVRGGWVVLDSVATVRAHQRLLREFLVEHLTGDRPLKAFAVWEGGQWNSGMEIATTEL
jgi:DNA repair protein RecO (recombination protein O)